MTAVKIKNLQKKFLLPHERRTTLKENVLNIFKKRTYEPLTVLDDVNLTIKKGEFLGIIGKNGSGKSTLLKLISKIYNPDKGEIEVNGEIAPFLELGIGFQPELTARQNIEINATLLGLTKQEIKQKWQEIVEFAELENFLDLKIKNYSSGMQARLAFSIASQTNADIYLCDEVLAVGDEQFQEKCINTFKNWHKEGKTIILVSHNTKLLEELCTSIVKLENGKITPHKTN